MTALRMGDVCETAESSVAGGIMVVEVCDACCEQCDCSDKPQEVG